MSRVRVEWTTADGRPRTDTFVDRDSWPKGWPGGSDPGLDWHLTYTPEETARSFVASLRHRGLRADIAELWP
jgi:hypothetical protein